MPAQGFAHLRNGFFCPASFSKQVLDGLTCGQVDVNFTADGQEMWLWGQAARVKPACTSRRSGSKPWASADLSPLCRKSGVIRGLSSRPCGKSHRINTLAALRERWPRTGPVGVTTGTLPGPVRWPFPHLSPLGEPRTWRSPSGPCSAPCPHRVLL